MLQELVGEGKLELLQEMYREWPFFQVTLDMVEMVFAKADPRVSLLYEEHLVSKDLVPFGDNLRRCANGSLALCCAEVYADALCGNARA